MVRKFITEMCEETKIFLKLIDFNGKEIFNNIPKGEHTVMKKIIIDNNIWELFLTENNKHFLPLINFTLLKLIKGNNDIELLLRGERSWEIFKDTPLFKCGKILLIECDNTDEVVAIVKDTYYGQEVYVERVYNNILIAGSLEDEGEHGFSLRDTILQSIGKKPYIGIGSFDGSCEGFIRGFNEVKEIIEIGKSLGIYPEVYIISEMKLDKAIYNLKEDYYKDLQIVYGEAFKNLGGELVQTLEEVFNCNLSLSKAAKKLFIHRNTLMYRIDKIKKEIGLDTRNFKEAAFLYMIYINIKRR